MAHLFRPVRVCLHSCHDEGSYFCPNRTANKVSWGLPPDPSSFAGAPPGEHRDVARDTTTPDDDLCFVLTQHDV